MRLGAIYGHKFTSLFPTDEALAVAKAEWSNALAGLSDFQIGQGLDRCRVLTDWNPTIPEFIRMAVNFPNIEVAIQRVLKRNIVDIVTRNIIQAIGGYDLKNKPTKELEKMIRGFYSDQYEYALSVMIGKDHNWQPPEQLEHKAQKEKPRTVEAAEKAVKEMQESLS